MALSGTINGSFTGTSTGNVKPVIEWKATQNIANNTSSVTASLVFIKANSAWYPFNLNGHNVTIGINGNKATSNRKIDMRSTSRQVIWTRTVSVAHAANGTKTIDLSASGATGLNLGSYNVNGKAELTTIPRTSSMTIAPTSLDFGKTVNFTIARAASGFTHTLNYNINGHAGNIVTKTTSTTPSWTIPNDLMKYTPTATSAKMDVWLDTFNGNSKIGNKKYTITVNVPASVVPTISAFSSSEGGDGAKKFGLTAANYLQGNSIINFASTAAATGGATLSKTTIGIDGIASFDKSSGSINLKSYSAHTGGKTARITVRDSRGRTASKTMAITINSYSPPKISQFTTTRKGSSVEVKKNCSFTSVGKNTLTYELKRSDGTVIPNITHDKNDYTLTGYAVDKSFVFTLKVTDLLTSSSSNSSVSTDKQLMHIDRDRGFGIGKYRENGILDVGGDTYLNGVTYLKGGIGATFVPAGADLNNYKKTGFYYNPSNADVVKMKNVPVGVSFSLIIEQHAGWRQTLSTYHTGDNRVYVRNFYDGAWGSWIFLGGVSRKGTIPASAGFKHYSTGNIPTVYREGNVVSITGAFSNNAVIKGSQDRSIMGVLPTWARPASDVIYVRSRNQGSGTNTFLLDILPNGQVCLSRYGGGGTAYKDVAAGSWLVIDCTFIGSEVYV